MTDSPDVIASAAQTDETSSISASHMTSRQKLTLIVLLATQFMIAADFSILSVAVPDIGESLRFSLGALQWITTAFALASAGFTLIFGRLADVLGRRRMFLAGMALLAVASLAGGLAQSPAMLLAARVGQGLATAITTPTALSLLTAAFPEGRLRQRALGLNGSLLSAGFIAGSVLGGILTGLLSWRWAFLINVVVGVTVMLIAPALLQESRSEGRVSLDIAGSLTVSGGLIALVFGVTNGGQYGWSSAGTVIALVAAVVLLSSFWWIEKNAIHPLVSTRMLARPTISWGNVGGLVTFTMMSSVVFLMTLYLQQALHYSALTTGLAFVGLGTAAFFGGMVAPRIIGRLGSKRTLVSALLLQAVSTAALLTLGDARSGLVIMLAATTVGGLGHVLSIVSFMVTATSNVADDERGLATGMASMTQQVGITIGIPVISTIAIGHTHVLQSAHSLADAVAGGVRAGVLVDTAVVVAGALLIAAFLRVRAARS